MAAPVIATVGAQATAANNAGLTVSKPTGTVDTDLLVLLRSVANSLTELTLSTPSGWTAGPTSKVAGGVTEKVALFHKAASSEPASYSLSNPGGDSNYGHTGIILRITGQAVIDYINASAATDGDTLVAPSVVTTVADCLLLCIAGSGALASVETFTAPSGMTEKYDFGVNPRTGGNSQTCASKTVASTGATGTQTFGGSGGNESTLTVAVAPLLVPTGGWGEIPI